MLKRCLSPQNREFVNYGGRGITVCERWRNSFALFAADMGPRPSPQHQIDRVNNDGNYEPSNVRWATPRQQGRNTRVNRKVVFNGEEMCATAFAEQVGLTVATVFGRLNDGWSVDRIAATPHRLKSRGLGITHNGETMSLRAWCARYGVKYYAVYFRLRRGIPFEKALLDAAA